MGNYLTNSFALTLGYAMSITLEGFLMSGRTVLMQTEQDATLDNVKHSVQSMLSVHKARLLTGSGRVLDGASAIRECDLRSGASLTLHIRQLIILATRWHPRQCSAAFASILGDSSVMTPGTAKWGDSSSAVQDKLKNVHCILDHRSLLRVLLLPSLTMAPR